MRAGDLHFLDLALIRGESDDEWVSLDALVERPGLGKVRLSLRLDSLVRTCDDALARNPLTWATGAVRVEVVERYS